MWELDEFYLTRSLRFSDGIIGKILRCRPPTEKCRPACRPGHAAPRSQKIYRQWLAASPHLPVPRGATAVAGLAPLRPLDPSQLGRIIFFGRTRRPNSAVDHLLRRAHDRLGPPRIEQADGSPLRSRASRCRARGSSGEQLKSDPIRHSPFAVPATSFGTGRAAPPRRRLPACPVSRPAPSCSAQACPARDWRELAPWRRPA
jgi:hypothetical protein